MGPLCGRDGYGRWILKKNNDAGACQGRIYLMGLCFAALLGVQPKELSVPADVQIGHIICGIMEKKDIVEIQLNF